MLQSEYASVLSFVASNALSKNAVFLQHLRSKQSWKNFEVLSLEDNPIIDRTCPVEPQSVCQFENTDDR